MLQQLLNEIQSGGTLETNVLASRLGASPQMILVMLEHLERAGYIHSYSSCSDGCQGCSLQSSCHSGLPGYQARLWQSVDFSDIANKDHSTGQ